MKRIIKKIAILGSGVMGSRIACHFANIGVQVLLLDIIPKEPSQREKAKGLTLEDKAVRNSIVNSSLETSINRSHLPYMTLLLLPGFPQGTSTMICIKLKTVTG